MKNFLFIFLLILASCGGDDFKKVEELNSFRILAITSSAPEVTPGTAVNLQLFISDVKGGGRVITGSTVACIDPGIALGARVNCDHDASRVTGSYTVDTTTGDLPSNLYTGLATDVENVTVPAAIFTGRSSREQFNGVGYIVIFTFNVDGEVVSAFKRIVATNRGTLNTNPSGTSIQLNGAVISRVPDKDDKLKVTTSAPETYDFINVDGSTETRIEEQQVAWYISKGEFDKPKASVSETTKYLDDAPTEPSIVVAIVRDERGGVGIVREFFP